ncbi:hypothetical protein PSACC_01405 [Paramicrosporidium saccamoebae]|uniref:Indoleamine 2,3-dioxygenase n=1 Tax=Paramicrosporidium saccamoebae TaxID=1246581 RepID=A0A2H9TM16_9FUNG|nr:hypothetical protein PSACC_01405 [Paramicrosporidium saccamoebae]
MPIQKDDGKPGLLATGKLGDASSQIPMYLQVANVDDSGLLSALFRDYTFWASAYLLEPCHLNLLAKGEYGLGREYLPKNIAIPLNIIAQKLGAKPFMEYAQSYAYLIFPATQVIDCTIGGRRTSRKELIHVAMVAHTPKLVSSTLVTLEGAEGKDRKVFNTGLKGVLSAMKAINLEMDTMWTRSDPNDYKEFRTFIMGIKSQPMFPNGVVYEGVSEKPVSYRGESGANDSIIPTIDNLLQVYQRMPNNPLTEILKDFRAYRPLPHTQWLEMVQCRAQKADLRAFAMGDDESAVLYLENLDQNREFRQRHWNFAKEYIIKHTEHPVATGGSPILTWLPNQLSTVLTIMDETASQIKAKSPLLDKTLGRMLNQKNILNREVQKLQQKFATK